MGNFISCGLENASSAHVVKVIHYDGLVEEFQRAMLVGELTVDYPNHFVCHYSHLNILERTPALPEEEELELGEIYFLLPSQSFQSHISESDMKALITKASTIRKESYKRLRNKDLPSKPFHVSLDGSTAQVTISEEFVARILADSRIRMKDNDLQRIKISGTPELQTAYTNLTPEKTSRSWKPRLETIEESGYSLCY